MDERIRETMETEIMYGCVSENVFCVMIVDRWGESGGSIIAIPVASFLLIHATRDGRGPRARRRKNTTP